MNVMPILKTLVLPAFIDGSDQLMKQVSENRKDEGCCIGPGRYAPEWNKGYTEELPNQYMTAKKESSMRYREFIAGPLGG